MKNEKKNKFGDKLKIVRERRGYTLKEVARLAGVSESLVSQIERARVSPSIDTLLVLADVLDLDLEYLFSDYRRKRRVSIVRAGDRPSTQHNNVTVYQLSETDPATSSHAIDAFLLEMEPAGEKGDREYGHAGREFGIILEGKAELVYGNETYQLEKGDSISFQSDMPHLFRNRGNDTLKAIWIVNPPRRRR